MRRRQVPTSASESYDLVRGTWSQDGTATDDGMRNAIIDPQVAAAANIPDLVDWSYARQAAALPS